MLLLTGATGYIGGRLLSRLEDEGWRVRCLCRKPETLCPRACERTEIVGGDLRDPASLATAMAGVRTAFYLVHSMAAGDSFEEEERAAARNFAQAAAGAGSVERIIYLGGLAQDEN